MARSVSSGNYLTKSTSADVGGVGSVFIRIKPSWSSGDSSAHYVWDYENVTFELSFQKYLDNNIYAGYNIIGGADARIVLSDAGLFSSGTWGNWLLDWDDTADLTHIYLNNVLKGTSSSTFTVSTGATTVRVGRGLAADRPLDADVAEFARWDHVLDSTERATLESTGNPACLPTGLVHHYKILGNDSPEPDEVGSEDLTLVGSPAQATHPTVGSCGTTYTLTAATGSFTETGVAAGLLYGRKVAADAAAFTETGISTSLLYGRKVAPAVGTFTETGVSAGLLAGWKLPASAASFTFAGQDIGFGRGYGLVVTPGAFSLSGQAAALTRTYTALAASTGAFTLTGQDAGLRFGYSMAGAIGSFALSGQSASLLAARRLALATGAFVLTGQDADMSQISPTTGGPIARVTRIIRPRIQ